METLPAYFAPFMLFVSAVVLFGSVVATIIRDASRNRARRPQPRGFDVLPPKDREVP